MTVNPRHAVLGASLAATLAAVAWLALAPDDEIVPAVPTVASARANQPPPAVAPRGAWPAPSPAALRAWGQPAPVPVRVAGVAAAMPTAPPPTPAAAAPAAPTAPYRWLGRVVEDGQARVLLSGATQTVLLGRGDVIDGQWRIEAVNETAIDLLWLPGGLKQRLVPAS